MMTKNQLLVKLNHERLQLIAIEEQMQGQRGVIEDVLRVVIPLHKKQIELMEETVRFAAVASTPAARLLDS